MCTLTRMRHAIFMPLFGALADPHAVADIARSAEESGWDGLFVWDHVLSIVPGEWEIAEPWIALAAAALATDRIRLGPMVTPLPRRDVITLARETVTFDRLSRGRLILGLGSGDDTGREFSAFGDIRDARQRAQALDEGTRVLTALWAGDTVNHRGAIVADNVRAIPGPVQQPRIPIWFGTGRTTGRPVERAARYDGVFPLANDPASIARVAETVAAVRGSCEGFDIAVMARRGGDLDTLRDAGATWAMHDFRPGHRPEHVLRSIARGVPA
jgi:alkanesulfonate monooxygenase SsuD/methylene tetrahydromethanopterin reductase-like flavin-dependent oxidoreductase (luciferase family)